MFFNLSKCVHLKITNRILTTNSTYFLKQHQICRSTSATYLGVTIDKHLKWTNHIQHVTCKANSANAFLRRNISSCTQQTKKLCYLAMVRPILEYASTVWSPYTNSSIYKLEMVQRRAARFITNNYSPWASVTEILDHLNLPTLEQRRNNLKLVMMYKMVHRLVHIDNGTYLIPTASQTRGHDQRFLQPHSRIDSYLYSYYPSTIKLWNNLSSSTVESPTLNTFKQCINYS